jgi:YHS domain-containing protein
MSLKKCAICNMDVTGEKCVFATHKRIVDGKEYYFCCEHHANEFTSK